VPVPPSKQWDLQQFASTQFKQTLHDDQLQYLSDGQHRYTGCDLARANQIGCDRLDRFENDEWHRKKRE